MLSEQEQVWVVCGFAVAILAGWVLAATNSLWLPLWREWRTYRYLRRQCRRGRP